MRNLTAVVDKYLAGYDPGNADIAKSMLKTLTRIKQVSGLPATELNEAIAAHLSCSESKAKALLAAKKYPPHEDTRKVLHWAVGHFDGKLDELLYVLSPLALNQQADSAGGRIDSWLPSAIIPRSGMARVAGKYLSFRMVPADDGPMIVAGRTEIVSAGAFAEYRSSRPANNGAEPEMEAVTGEGLLLPNPHNVLLLFGRTGKNPDNMVLWSGHFQEAAVPEATDEDRVVLVGTVSNICDVRRTPLQSAAVLYGACPQDVLSITECDSLGQVRLSEFCERFERWVAQDHIRKIQSVLSACLSGAPRPAERYRAISAGGG